MNIQDPFSVAGLLLDIVGAWLLAYEIIWGYSKRFRRQVSESKLQQLHSFMEDIIQGNKNLPCPPYTKEEIDNEIKEFKEKWAPKVERLENEIYEYTEGHKDKSFSHALLGIILMTIGFSLQIYSAI